MERPGGGDIAPVDAIETEIWRGASGPAQIQFIPGAGV